MTNNVLARSFKASKATIHAMWKYLASPSLVPSLSMSPISNSDSIIIFVSFPTYSGTEIVLVDLLRCYCQKFSMLMVCLAFTFIPPHTLLLSFSCVNFHLFTSASGNYKLAIKTLMTNNRNAANDAKMLTTKIPTQTRSFMESSKVSNTWLQRLIYKLGHQEACLTRLLLLCLLVYCGIPPRSSHDLGQFFFSL